MEPVGSPRRKFGNSSWSGVAIRRNLLVFLIGFGLVNVILVVLYPQMYGGELLRQLNPTSSDEVNSTRASKIKKITHINRILSLESGIETKKTINPASKNVYIPTKDTSAKNANRPSLVIKQYLERESPKSSKGTTNGPVLISTTRYQEVLDKRRTFTKENVTTEKITESLKTTATTLASTTHFQKISIEEPVCKLYDLSAKSVEYTAKKYAIRPDVTKCKDQKAPTNELCKVNEIKGNDSYTNLEIKCDFSVCNRSEQMSIEYMDIKDGLMKKYEIQKNASNSEIALLVRKFAEDVRKQDLPFLFVNCTGVNRTVVAQILTFLPSLPTSQENAHRKKISVSIFLVDSVSRPHFYRSFPKTIDYLKEIKNDAQYPANVFNFELFQAVHGHTNENERALFEGVLFPVHLGGKARDRTPVNLNPLFGVFKEAGFQTMFLDDLCWRAHWGIMDKYKIGGWETLQEKLKVSNIDTRGRRV